MSKKEEFKITSIFCINWLIRKIAVVQYYAFTGFMFGLIPAIAVGTYKGIHLDLSKSLSSIFTILIFGGCVCCLWGLAITGLSSKENLKQEIWHRFSKIHPLLRMLYVCRWILGKAWFVCSPKTTVGSIYLLGSRLEFSSCHKNHSS